MCQQRSSCNVIYEFQWKSKPEFYSIGFNLSIYFRFIKKYVFGLYPVSYFRYLVTVSLFLQLKLFIWYIQYFHVFNNFWFYIWPQRQ